jgi:hypothetical protein
MPAKAFLALSPAEVAEHWAAWEARERRHDRRAGVIASVLAEIHRNEKRRPTPFVPGDFFDSLAEDPRTQTPDDVARMALLAFGAEDSDDTPAEE